MIALALAAAFGLLAHGQKPDPHTAFGSGLVVLLVSESGTPPHARREFSISKAGVPEAEVRFEVVNAASKLVRIQVHNARTISVVGETESGLLILSVVEAEAGRLLFEAAGSAVKIAPDGRWIATVPSDGGRMRAFDILEHRRIEVRPAVPGALAILAGSRIADKRKVIAEVRRSSQMKASDQIVQALLSELRDQLETDMVRAAEAGTSIRDWVPERDYLGELMTVLGELRCLDAIAAMTRADHPAMIGALAGFGAEAIRSVVSALRLPVPDGYSEYYRSRLLEALTLIVTQSPGLDEVTEREVVDAVVNSLSRPHNWREMDSALTLADECDDARLDLIAGELSQSAQEVTFRGITVPDEVRRVMEKAAWLSSRHVKVR